MDALSVCASVGLPSALWKNGRSNPDAVWHRRSDWSRDEAGNGVWGSVQVLLETNLGRAIVTNGDFAAYVCDSASTVGELRFEVVRAVSRGIAVLDGGSRCARGRKGFGGFVPHFHNGKRRWVAEGEMFPIRMRKLDNISIRQTYRWKARFVGFLAI